jgi:hypothetical protein
MLTARDVVGAWSRRALNVEPAAETVAAFTERGMAAHRERRQTTAWRIGGTPAERESLLDTPPRVWV